MIDFTITAGNIITIISIVGGGLYVLVNQNVALTYMGKEISAMQKQIEKISNMIADNAVRDQRLLNLEEDIRDLKRGTGFVREVSGEYMLGGKVINQPKK